MTDTATLRVIVSVHDVMPATLGRTEALCRRLMAAGAWPATLLVVPGSGWDDITLARLRALVAAGAELAGHGWSHRASEIRGWYHRLHSALISRDVAEHLALDAAGIAVLVDNCFHWFAASDLPEPELYVPPAWALGSVSRSALAALPFRYYETLSGVLDAQAGRFQVLPMQGFEADNGLRTLACRVWNGINRLAAGARPVRIAIHPYDPELRLAGDLEALLRSPLEALGYGDLARC